MAYLPTQTVTLSSVDPVYTVPEVGGDTFDPGDRTFIHVRNGGGASGASITITVDDPNSFEPEASIAFDPDVATTVEAGGQRFVGPFKGSRFQLADDSFVHMSCDSVDDVEVAVLSINFGVT